MQMEPPAVNLNRLVGQALRDLRISRGRQQEQVAAAARALGVPWTRSTVTAIERGGRQVFLHELLLIPNIFQSAGITREDGTPFEIRDLLSDALIARWRSGLAQVSITPATAHLGLQGGPPSLDTIAREDAIQKGALRFKVSPTRLAQAALRAWGHGFQEEREARLRSEASRGYRGHVSRVLFRELGLIAGPKRSRKKR
jgi:transcriptional regulator with XRE-family HTH domain